MVEAIVCNLSTLGNRVGRGLSLPGRAFMPLIIWHLVPTAFKRTVAVMFKLVTNGTLQEVGQTGLSSVSKSTNASTSLPEPLSHNLHLGLVEI